MTKGGSLMNDVGDLAIPFALLLAKKGLDKLSESKNRASNASKPKPKKSPKAKSPKAKKVRKAPASTRKSQKGGDSGCSLCAAATIGGGVHDESGSRKHVMLEFQRLTTELRSLLGAY